MKRAALSFALIAPLYGCAATPPPLAPDSGAFIGYVTPHRGAKAGDTFKVTTNGLSSATVQIGRAPDGFRGRVRGAPIEVHVEGDELLGTLGGQPIHLRIEREGDKLRVHGLYGGAMAAFQIATHRDGACDARQPSLSIEGQSDPCASQDTIQGMRLHLAQNEAMALLSVILFSNAGSYRDLLPGTPPPSLRSPIHNATSTPSAHTGRARG
jgi:hypothetical protein